MSFVFFGPFWLWPLYSFIFNSSYTFHHSNIFKFVSVTALIEINLNVWSKVCGLFVDQSLNKTPFTKSNAASSLICLFKMSQRWVLCIKMFLPSFERKHFFSSSWNKHRWLIDFHVHAFILQILLRAVAGDYQGTGNCYKGSANWGSR